MNDLYARLARVRVFCAPASLVALLLIFSATTFAQNSQTFVVAFSQQSGLPANVDQIIANAGGTITIRMPEIGGIGVTSSNPNFATQIAADPSVKAAGVATQTKLIDPVPDSGTSD